MTRKSLRTDGCFCLGQNVAFLNYKKTHLNSHLSVHLVNRLLRENWKSIPKLLSGKNFFKNVTLQILNYIEIS